MQEFTTPLCKKGTASHREQWPVMLVCMLLFTAAALYFLIDSLSTVALFIVSLPFMLFCAIMALAAFLELQQLLGNVCVTAEGVTVISPFSSPRRLAWNDFQQVCICLYVSGRGMLDNCHPQLCFVRKGEQRSIHDRWKTHNPFHHHKLIAIDYDEEVFHAIRALCPLEIVDLRSTPPYHPFNKEASR